MVRGLSRVQFGLLLYNELSNSFLIGQKRVQWIFEISARNVITADRTIKDTRGQG